MFEDVYVYSGVGRGLDRLDRRGALDRREALDDGWWETRRVRIVDALRQQAVACGQLGSPMYAGLLERLAEDVEDEGPVSAVLAGHDDDSGPSGLALRLLGSVHRLVLERRAGALAAYYPSVGGTWDPEDGGQAFLELCARSPEPVGEWLDRPPQTNEVGRAAALLGGLLHLEEEWRLPVRLHEIGSSGGLNLLADRFAHVDDRGVVHGDPDSPVRLDPAWRGEVLRPWPELEVRTREGCDLLPVDVGTTEGRLALTAYVWPDQTARHERLRGAIALGQQTPPTVLRAGAGDFVDGIELEAGTTTVLWHSVMWQYLPAQEQQRIERRIAALGATASAQAPFAHVFLEPTRREAHRRHEFLVVLTTWPDGVRRVLGRAPGHGLPVTWEPPVAG